MMSDERQVNREENFIEIITFLIEGIATHKAMQELLKNHKANNAFIIIFNNNFMMIIIRLSNIFGVDGEDNHWKKLFSDYDEFRKNVILKVFDNIDEYKKYCKNLVEIRNRYIVHFKVGKDKYYSASNLELTFPVLDKAKVLLKNSLIFLLKYYDYTIEHEPNSEFDMLFKNTYDNAIELFEKKFN